jgi:hypothetical protein
MNNNRITETLAFSTWLLVRKKKGLFAEAKALAPATKQ